MANARGLSIKQKAFASAYIANGGNAAAAYRAAYKSLGNAATCTQAGQKLLKHPLIGPLVDEYRKRADLEAAKAVEVAGITKAQLIADMARLHRNACLEENIKDAVAAGTLIAKLSGWIIERRDIRQIKSLNDLSDEELAAIKAEAQKELADQASGDTRH